jgi:hypothetical protein
MFGIRKAVVIFASFLVAAAASYATPASAQATRTWVSGTGDDVNPCSRTAPCKTFAGAISKTAAGGEINCLDAGGFGAVTINKSLTISCPYTEGGVLAGGNGIVVNAGPTDTVYLRGLDIFGVNPPSNGVRIIAGGAVHIENCIIRRFNAANSFGVSFQPSGATQLFISNTTIAENGNGASGGGILIQPTGAGGSARVRLSNVHVYDNANNGLQIATAGNTSAAGVRVSIEDSNVDGNGNGISLVTAAGTSSATLTLTDSTVVNNTGFGLGINGAGSLMLVGTTTIQHNASGLAISGGQILSYGTNLLNVNIITDGVFSGPAGKS